MVPAHHDRAAQIDRGACRDFTYKGDCSYYGIPDGGAKAKDAVCSYEAPYAAVEAIRGYLAFYPNRVEFLGKVES